VPVLLEHTQPIASYLGSIYFIAFFSKQDLTANLAYVSLIGFYAPLFPRIFITHANLKFVSKPGIFSDISTA